MTYDTMNELGSEDPRDLIDNSRNLDHFMLSAEEAFPDRLGRPRATLTALENATPVAVEARLVAEQARDAALAAAGPLYSTEEQGRAVVDDGETFKVLGNGSVAVIVYRRASAAASVYVTSIPAADAVTDLQQLISASQATEPIEVVVDEEGGVHRILTPTLMQDRVHRVEEIEGGGALLSEDGGVMLYQDAERTVIGPMELGHTDFPGVFVVDSEGGVHAELAGVTPATDSVPQIGPLDAGAYFAGTLVGAQGVPINVHVPSLIAERLRGTEVIATINSTSTSAVVSGSDTLSVTADTLGSVAHLVLRNRSNASDRLARTLSVKTVPVPADATAPIRILYIGDSIGNRQGLKFLDDILKDWGYLPEWVGTINSSAQPGDPDDASGPLGECREAWEAGDYTFNVSDRALVLPPGQEASYLGMSKASKWARNPFLRAATESDAVEDVRNGHVLDFSFYQSRFGLMQPDVVVWSLGTNDIRERAAAELFGLFGSNDGLVYRRLAAAWPGVKVIRTLPGTAVDASRETAWSSKYIPALRGLLDAAAGKAAVTVAPAWALANHESGYAYSSAPDPITGFTAVNAFADGIHPVESTRLSLYLALAPYVAAAGLNLI